VRNVTANAVRLRIPFGALEAAPHMSAEAAAQVIAGNRARYAATHDQSRPAAAKPDLPRSDAPATGGDWRS